jgi:CRP-like cAMP-binding protein
MCDERLSNSDQHPIGNGVIAGRRRPRGASISKTTAGISMLAPLSPNRLLAALPAQDFELLRPHLQTVNLVREAVLVAAGDRLAQAIFPHSGVISLVVSLSAGETVEVGMIGRDSVFGGAAALDGGISLTDAVVQLSGTASTLDIERLRTVANQSVVFRTRLIRHEQALFAQAQQSAACNASHSAESRLARWLLRMHDLAEVEDLPLTQDFLAQMIGVKRNSVSLVAHILQAASLIKYTRGHIKILNIDGLRDISCECYAAVNAQHLWLLNNA